MNSAPITPMSWPTFAREELILSVVFWLPIELNKCSSFQVRFLAWVSVNISQRRLAQDKQPFFSQLRFCVFLCGKQLGVHLWKLIGHCFFCDPRWSRTWCMWGRSSFYNLCCVMQNISTSWHDVYRTRKINIKRQLVSAKAPAVFDCKVKGTHEVASTFTGINFQTARMYVQASLISHIDAGSSAWPPLCNQRRPLARLLY